MKSTLYFLIPFLLLSTCSNFHNKTEDVLEIDGGKISGIYSEESGIQIFKGIPFAAPPVGEFRWMAPEPVVPWEGIKKCDAFGPSPIQAAPRPFMFWSQEFLIPEEPISEDCLYLNVWTKGKNEDEKLPVMVYIYGGGFSSGGSGCPIYDGENMAKKDVVFVSINYRVGVFGFLAHPELSKESERGTSGNYAILDMIAALKWVNKNIGAFGGDPNNVTIVGTSAGAFAVNYLTVSPLAKGLFRKAIAQSGAAFLSNPLRPGMNLESGEKAGLEYARKMGAESVADLRAKSSDEILQSQGGLSRPIIDGKVIPESVMDSYKNNRQNDVPVIVGWNKDDKLIAMAQPADKFKEQMQKRFGDLAEDFFKVYPVETEEEATQSQYDMSRDQAFGSQMFTWANVQSSSAKSDVYMYNFNRALPAYDEKTAFGAFHGGEMVYAYDNLHTLDRPWEPTDQRIADIMSQYWVNFAKNGNPNGDGVPDWDPYDKHGEKAMIFDITTEQMALPNKDKLSFWGKYYASLHNK